MTNRAVRERLLASTIIAGAIVAAAPAFAQDQVAPPPPPSQPSGLQTTESTTPAPNSQGEIVVTGSLIKNPALTASAPVQSIGQEEVQLRQSNVAEEVLRDLPGAVPNVGSAVNNGNGGASFVDLRGLGPNRNLVLLDGHRIVNANLGSAVDLNNIPLALIQSTQALTGGAATTYGADAVAGVVNFITRSDFSGAEVNAGSQITGKGDGPYYRADVTVGANFDDGKGNAVLSLGYQHADPVYQGDRPFGYYNIDSFAGVGTGSGTTVPARFTGAGLPTSQVQINPTTGALGAYTTPFNFNPYNVYQTPFVRFNIYGAGHYDISDSIEIYTRGLYSKNTVSTIIAPSGIFGSIVTIPYSNPYLPAAARAQFCSATAANVNNPLVLNNPYANGGALTAAQCAAAAAATSPSDPNFRAFTTSVSRRTTETGPRQSNYTTQLFDYRAGMKLSITNSLKLDINGSYGESVNNQDILGYVLTSRARSAAFATNTTTCLGNAPGGAVNASTPCVPVNLFGGAGSISSGAADYLTSNSSTSIRTSLGQAQAVLNGDFGVHSPFAHDAISFAAGAEYRKYTATQLSDLLGQTPGELGGSGGATPNIHGAYDVTEGFAEVIAPLVQDAPLASLVQAEGGFRYSHYKVDAAGSPTFNTKTYKGGLQYAPIPAVKFRGEYQRAVRAPNIAELFSPVVTGLTTVTVDPCASFTADGVRRQATPTPGSNLYNVCIAQGATAANIATISNPTANQGNELSGGNPDLKPEKSDSYTAGIVLQPRGMLRGFSLTVDYYRIKVTGAISTPSSTDALISCFGPNYNTPGFDPGAGAATNPACTGIRRNLATGQLDGDSAISPGIPLQLSNLGKLFTDGIDLNANYRRDLGFAKLNVSFQGNWTNRSKFQSSPTSLDRDCVGFYSASCASIQPKFYWNQRTTLTFGAIDVSLLWRHIDGVRQEPDDVVNGNGPAYVGVLNPTGALRTTTGLDGQTVNFGKIPTYNYLDLSTRLGISENLDLTITVENLLDRKPPIVGTGVGTTAFNSGNTYPSTYDALGRRFAAGIRMKF